MDTPTPNYTIELIARLDAVRSMADHDRAISAIVDYAFDGVMPDFADITSWVELTRAENAYELEMSEGRVMADG